VARIVVDCLRYHEEELGQYELEAFVLMPNHVHALIHPRFELARIMQSLKGFSAHQANKVLRRTGQPFWQRESYDHWVRTSDEAARIKRYIEHNPVKAGLAASPADWPWSSAAPR
jgi:type I restriction enzyme R subunit/putative DNA methylase